MYGWRILLSSGEMIFLFIHDVDEVVAILASDVAFCDVPSGGEWALWMDFIGGDDGSTKI